MTDRSRGGSAGRRRARLAGAALVALLAGGCGGGDGAADAPSAPAPAPAPAPPPPQRGQATGAPTLVGTYSTSDLLSFLTDFDLGRELVRSVVTTPTCTVESWKLGYHTVGGRNEPTTASTALLVPKGTDARCQGPRPVVVYAHGTRTDRATDLARLTDRDNAEGLAVAAVFAAQGYLVVAPNYAGYDGSALGYHPYLVAEQQANDVVDALTAARGAFAATGASAAAKLFVTGYSQGGYVAMATHRALQAAGTPPTASAPLSGPYALAAFGDALFLGQVGNGAVTNFTLLANGYQRSYGDLYSTPGEVYAARYAPGIEAALPTTSGVGSLVAQGLLPRDALFPATPPAPQYASITPATQPAALVPVFARGFGADALVTNAYRLAYLTDVQAHPDGGFPTLTDGLPPAAPANALRRALKRNDLRAWTAGPSTPMLLCGGREDPTVLWFNTELMQRLWARTAPGARVTVLDVDAPPVTDDPYRELRTGFALAKAALQLRSGRDAVLESYHAGLVSPFCLAAARTFFDAN